MIVAFDGICLGDGPVTGVGRAFLDGLAAYARTGGADCVLLLPAGAVDPALPGVRTAAAPRGALRRQRRLPTLLRELRADVLHSSVASVPARAPCRTIATVHDLPWLHPELGERHARWHTWLLARLVARAATIVVPSHATAADVRAWLGPRTPPLAVVPHGTALGPAPSEAGTAARAGPFLVLGDDRPRKNRAALRAAHARAHARVPDLPPLRFVGPPDGWVDEAAKRVLLRECRALVHVSLFEGFGLPVLEGMAHGAPVLASDLPPHREIAVEHARFVDPRDVGALAEELVVIHRDAALRWRLARDGHARAAAFSCEQVAVAWRAVHAGAHA